MALRQDVRAPDRHDRGGDPVNALLLPAPIDDRTRVRVLRHTVHCTTDYRRRPGADAPCIGVTIPTARGLGLLAVSCATLRSYGALLLTNAAADALDPETLLRIACEASLGTRHGTAECTDWTAELSLRGASVWMTARANGFSDDEAQALLGADAVHRAANAVRDALLAEDHAGYAQAREAFLRAVAVHEARFGAAFAARYRKGFWFIRDGDALASDALKDM